MSDWLEEVENLERICEETECYCQCKLGYCIKECGKDTDVSAKNED